LKRDDEGTKGRNAFPDIFLTAPRVTGDSSVSLNKYYTPEGEEMTNAGGELTKVQIDPEFVGCLQPEYSGA
jgi:hypothetical protein